VPLKLLDKRLKQLPLKRIAAMTIGVGFLCPDGIVLCSDRLHSGQGYKFQQSKIFSIQRQDYSFIFSFAGDPDSARMMFEKTRDAMRMVTVQRDESVKDVVKQTLEKVFSHKQANGLQTLIGVKTKEDYFLIKTIEKKVVEGSTEYIGCGDSSVLRYICDLLLESQLTTAEAVVIGTYIVSVAGRYVEQCGEDSNHATGVEP